MSDDRPIIIIKKVKKVEGGHHGGAWKVAYADFVTAMMAFFLLLWLLNVSTDEQKLGIANYFDPVSVSRSTSGSGGVLGGKSMLKDGAMVSPTSPMGLDLNQPGVSAEKPAVERDDDSDEFNTFDPPAFPDENNLSLGLSEEPIGENEETKDVSKQQLAELIEEKESEAFEKAAAAIREEIASDPDLAKLAPHLMIDQTPEGLRIQIIDQEGRSMFASGSAQLYDYTRELFEAVTKVVTDLPNNIKISGHTDSVPYRSNNGYDNWNLSSDRANTARKALIQSGFSSDRIKLVAGKADTEPLIPDDTKNARNRRVSVVLLKESLSPTGAYDGMEVQDGELAPSDTAPVRSNRRIKPVEALDYIE
tara:strand:+ start:265 stop:1353 length:1089 start_codon:yes stop_codon:yes gene_type:complete